MASDGSSNVTIAAKVSAAMLVLAVFPTWSIGYYDLLRLVVCLSAVYIALYAKRVAKSDRLLWIMIVIALLYNPISPIYVNRGLWSLLHLVAAAVFWITATSPKRLS